tara:strand:- start:40900 stop:43959 length:3060 start_codon:yes stop_codon:yes gene_type:complete
MHNYEPIEQIQIGAFAPGTWRNAVIFSVDFDVGFNGNKTKFIINVVNTTGDYAIDESDLSYLNPYNITFGPFKFKFFLESYEINKAAGKKLLRLTFVDGSTLLDRVYVALGDKNRKLNENAWFLTPVNFPVLCEAPEYLPPAWSSNGLVNLSQQTIMPIKHSALDPMSIIRNPRSVESGGMITVGWEIPTIDNFHQDCSITEFKYNFTHLLEMMTLFGIGVEGDFIRRDATGNPLINSYGGIIFADRNPFHYKSVGGDTLRNILNTWCQSQGFSWYYSWNSNSIVGIDEHASTGWARFEAIKRLVSSVKSQDNSGKRIDALIEQATESVTLEGTKRKYVTTSVIKNAKPDSETKKTYYRSVKFSPLDPSHIFAPNQRGKITGLNNTFRDDTQLRISASLARYNKNAREIFNVGIGCHEAIGVEILAEIDLMNHPTINGMGPAALQLATMTALANMAGGQGLINTMNGWLGFWQIPFKMYFVKYNDTLEDRWLTWEKNVSNLYGKHYLNFDKMQRMFRCDPNGHGYFKRMDTTLPNSEEFSKDDIINGKRSWPNDIKDTLTGPHGLSIGINNNLFAFYDKINMLTRGGSNSGEPAWETSQEEVDAIFQPVQNASDILEEWTPRIVELPAGGAQQILLRFFPHLNAAGGAGGNVVHWAQNMMTFQSGLNAQLLVNILNQPQAPAAAQGGGATAAIQAKIAAGYKVGLMMHPDYSHPNFPFKIKNVSYTEYENTKEKSIKNSMNYNNSYLDPCPLLCSSGVSPRQRLCEDLNRFFQPKAWPVGLERWNLGTFKAPYWSLPAFGFQMEFNFPPDALNPNWQIDTVDIVHPTWTAHLVNHKIDIERRLLDPKIMLILNQMQDNMIAPGNVAEMEMIDYDVSHLASNDPTGGQVKINLPGASVNPWNLGSNFQNFGRGALWDSMLVRKLHEDFRLNGELPIANAISALPRKTLSCTVAGMNFGSLSPFLNPSFGLESVSIRMSQQDGVTSELKFSNKPPSSLGKDIRFRSIETDLIRLGGLYPMF